MQKCISFLVLLFLCVPLFAFAEDFRWCYNPKHLNPEGNTLEEICEGGQIYDNFEDIKGPIIHYTPIGAYKPGRISTGVFLPQSYYNNTYVGYWGTNFTDRTIKMPANNTPVGMFQNYKNKNIFFPTQEEKTYTSKKVFFPGQNTKNTPSGGNIKNTTSQCPPPQTLTNQKIEMVNNGYTDQIKISFDPTPSTSQVKIVQIFPNNNITNLAPNTFSYTQNIQYPDQNYQYILVSYNPCDETHYSNILQITPNTPTQDKQTNNTLTNSEALHIISNQSDPINNMYYIFPQIQANQILNAQNLSLFLINLKTKIALEDPILALKIFQYLGLIKETIPGSQEITTKELSNILEKINKQPTFTNDVIFAINKTFKLTASQLYTKLQRLSAINTLLQEKTPTQQDQIKECLNNTQCLDIPYYRNFMTQVETQVNNRENKATEIGIDTNTNTTITMKDYILMLFEIIGQDAVGTGKYSLSEYTKFMTILRDAVVMGESNTHENITFLDIEAIKIELINDFHFFESVVYITQNYLRVVNSIYDAVVDRDKLFMILKNYLE